jgi:hypothetical protein
LKEKTMRATLLSVLVFMIGPGLFAEGGATCKDVGGTVLTNFIDQATTLGTATGDLRGGLGVNVLSIATGANGSTVFHNHHHWVTEAGDTILLADADATAYQTPIAGLYAASYNNGVQITGGTGRFAGASGTLSFFGAVNLGQGQIILRYAGQVCLRPVATH